MLAFADDLILMVENQDQAKTTLEQLASLESHGIIANCDKNQIMTDRGEIKDVTAINVINLTNSITFLGVKIYCVGKSLQLNQKSNEQVHGIPYSPNLNKKLVLMHLLFF